MHLLNSTQIMQMSLAGYSNINKQIQLKNSSRFGIFKKKIPFNLFYNKIIKKTDELNIDVC